MKEPTPPVRVLLADDEPFMLQLAIKVLEARHHIIGTAPNGKELVTAAEQHRPDVIVIDFNMPVMDGLEAARHLQSRNLEAKVIFLTSHDEEFYATQAFSAGARGYVVKAALFPDLVDAVEKVIAGDFFISSKVQRVSPITGLH